LKLSFFTTIQYRSFLVQKTPSDFVTRKLPKLSMPHSETPTNGTNGTTDSAELMERIKANAMAVWPGMDRNFEVRILHPGDGAFVSAVLVEIGAARGIPRTMSGLYSTEMEALEDVDKQLTYMVEEQWQLEGET
jgi:hypothetical protein